MSEVRQNPLDKQYIARSARAAVSASLATTDLTATRTRHECSPSSPMPFLMARFTARDSLLRFLICVEGCIRYSLALPRHESSEIGRRQGLAEETLDE